MLLDNSFAIGYDATLQWIQNNPWIIPVGGAVVALIVLIFELAIGRPRAVERLEQSFGNNEYLFRKEIRKRDITFLVLNGVFFVVPFVTVVIMYLVNKDFVMKDYGGWVGNGFLIYYLVTSIVMAIVRKDFLLLILWKIPTLTLFFHTHNTVDKGYYDVTVYSDGTAKVDEHFSWATIILGIIGFMLFALKVLIMFVYLIILALGNIILSAIIFPIVYGIYIGKDTKAIKEAEKYNY